MEVLRILGMESCRIGDMSLLTDIRDSQPYRSLGHDMHIVWTDVPELPYDTPRECEGEADLFVSEEWYT